MKNFKAAIFLILLLCLGNTISGQHTPGTAPGSPAGSVPLSEIDTINYFSGRLNINIPIRSLPARGDASVPIFYPLGQNNWMQKFIVDPYEVNHYYPERGGRPGEETVLAGGNGLGTMIVRHLVYSDAYCGGSGYTLASRTLTLLNFNAPDGTTYEFRDRDHEGRVNQTTGCTFGAYYYRGTVFVSNDGNAATFVSDQPLEDFLYPGGTADSGATGYLYLRDGTVYRFQDGSMIWRRDRNGNMVTLGTSGYKDSVGREYSLSGSGNVNTLTYAGFQGNSRSVQTHNGLMEDSLADGHTLKTYRQLFPALDYASTTLYFNPSVITKIVLPDNREYKFFYNSYGDFARIELPTGAAIEYDWLGSVIGSLEGSATEDSGVIHRRVVERRLYENGVTLTNRLVIGRVGATDLNATITVDTYDPSSLLLNRTKHFYYGTPIFSTNPYYMYTHWKDGKEFQTQHFAENGTTLLRQTNRTWQLRSILSWWNGNPDEAPPNDARIIETTNYLADSNQISKQTFTYDDFSNLTDTFEYDYGIGAPGAFLRRSHTDYVTDTNYTSQTGSHLRSLHLQSWISSDLSGNNKVSLSQFEYDNYTATANHANLVARSNVVGHDTANFGTGKIRRGNVSAFSSYANAQSQTGAVSTYSQYDILGNVVKTIDGRGFVSTISYNDNFGFPDGEARINTAPSSLGGQNTFAFATSLTNPLGWTVYAQFDYHTSAPLDAEDAFLHSSQMTFWIGQLQ